MTQRHSGLRLIQTPPADDAPARWHGADCDQDQIVALDEPAPARDYCPTCGNVLPNAQLCYELLHPAEDEPAEPLAATETATR